MRMAKDGRLRKPRPVEWPLIFRRLIPPTVWRAFCGRVDAGDRRTHWAAKYVVLCWTFMGWACRSALSERFTQSWAALAALYASRRRPGRTFQSLVKAGARITPGAFLEFWYCLREQFAALLGPAWLWHGWVVLAVDGSRIEAPRTRANERILGRAGRENSGPQWWVTTLIHLPSRLLWSWRQGHGTSSERGHLREMLAELPARTLLLADAGFVGFELLRGLTQRGADFLIRCGANVTLLIEDTHQCIERHGASQIVYLWPGKQRSKRPLKLRLITLRRGRKTLCLLTNVLDSTKLSGKLAGRLYAARWGVELNFRGLKQTLERRKLTARTPETGALELAGNVVALGLLLAHAAWLMRGQIGHASIAALLRIVRAAIEALIWGHRSPWFARRARTARRDDYQRRRSKRARHWPHKKTDRPPRPPKLRKMTSTEITAITRWKHQHPETTG